MTLREQEFALSEQAQQEGDFAALLDRREEEMACSYRKVQYLNSEKLELAS